ncbi:signal recognition particle-docking protein FtsY [Marinisporobacter balticus]|uniref:Signal recognition particle receptor FtsY n=1 Tax=Marinisporobacter balticus TaxID=2018667 RepID=A0A4R2KWU5_9FIRM|nr:signal recognition particle-docking protein FtsY [Marinisporobacter balticus]TCO79011.1 signal recognition particle-docking protein FtsY [Marinisporobacter balticus]
MFKKILSKLKKEKDENVEAKRESANVEEKEAAEEVIKEETNEIEFEKLAENRIQEEEKRDNVQEYKIEEPQKQNVAEEKVQEIVEEKGGFFAKLKKGLTKTRQGITSKVDQVLKTYKKVDEELFEEIEEILITSDAGVNTTMEIIDRLRNLAKERKITEAEDLKGLLKEILTDLLKIEKSNELNVNSSPTIILMVGVNGAGKTTSIGKIAYQFKEEGKKVLLAAGDTFRAAAIDQLEIWGNRVGVDVIKHQEGADTAAVIYDAIQSAKARKIDVLICDTAGRLHNKKNLMNELGKVGKIVEREFPEASKEVLLVLDATTGQNAIQQAKVFKEVTDITGVVLTKLDGTAKGGVVLGISSELDIPVKLIGVGEGINDLQKFVPQDFVNALFGDDN